MQTPVRITIFVCSESKPFLSPGGQGFQTVKDSVDRIISTHITPMFMNHNVVVLPWVGCDGGRNVADVTIMIELPEELKFSKAAKIKLKDLILEIIDAAALFAVGKRIDIFVEDYLGTYGSVRTQG